MVHRCEVEGVLVREKCKLNVKIRTVPEELKMEPVTLRILLPSDTDHSVKVGKVTLWVVRSLHFSH